MRRTVANMVAAKGWRYAKCGMPAAVLQEQQWDAPKAGEGEVVVKMLAAPILGEDLQMVMGTLGGLQAEAYPAVAGTQGVGEVVEVGKGALTAKGSRVLLSNYAVGSWATKVTTDAVNVQALDAKAAAALEPGQLALLPVYCSAVAMAKEYGDVKGKTAVVLGSDLPVGAALAAVLASHGASVTSIASTSTDASHSADFIFNGVGGSLLNQAVSAAKEGATVVTFDNVSRDKMDVDGTSIVVKNVKLVSFWYARWLRQGIPETRKGVIAEATKALQKKSVPSATFSFSKDFAAAFDSVHNRGTVPVLLM